MKIGFNHLKTFTKQNEKNAVHLFLEYDKKGFSKLKKRMMLKQMGEASDLAIEALSNGDNREYERQKDILCSLERRYDKLFNSTTNQSNNEQSNSN